MLRGRPRLVRAVPRRLSHNARHYGTSSVVIPAISPRRGRADAAPFFRLALRRSGCRRRLALSHAAPGAPNPTPPIPPTPGARGALSASPPRAAATPSSGRRTAPDHTGDRASKARTKRRRKRPPLRGRTQRPPLPPHAARGGAGRLRLRGAKHFLLARGRREKIARPASGRQGQALRARRLRPGTTRRAPAFLLGRAKAKNAAPSPPKKNVGGAQGTAPRR